MSAYDRWNQGRSRRLKAVRRLSFRKWLKQALWRAGLLVLLVAAASLALVFLSSLYDYTPKYNEPKDLQREAIAGKP
jgi:hypothetical protein